MPERYERQGNFNLKGNIVELCLRRIIGCAPKVPQCLTLDGNGSMGFPTSDKVSIEDEK